MSNPIIELLLSPPAVALATIVTIVTGGWFLYDQYRKWQRKRRCRIPPRVPVTQIELETPEGEVPLNSKFYLERPPVEANCYAEIEKANALIRIKAPRQMGKSSLIARILHHAKQTRQAKTVALNLQNIDEATVQDLDKFLQWFTGRIAKQLQINFHRDEHWDNIYGSKTCCEDYFQTHILPHIQAPILVIALDEVDRVFQYDNVAQEFLGMLRAWHEAGKNKADWQPLQFILAHSQEVYIQLDINQSPFNVGLGIELKLFNFAQAKQLMIRHGLRWSDNDLKKLTKLIGGHPYLLRLAYYQIAKGELTLSELLQTATRHDGIYQDHLRRHWQHLQQYDLAQAMKQIVIADHPIPVTPDVYFKLRSLGLIRLVDNNEVVPRFDLYRQYFKNTL